MSKRMFALLAALLLAGLLNAALAQDVVFTGDSHVRVGPDLNAASFATVRKGDRLEYSGDWSVDDRGVTWYQVAYGSRLGWVSSKYSYVQSDDFGYGSGEVVVNEDSFVRREPSLEGAKLGTALRDDILDFLGDIALDDRGVAWYRVAYGNAAGWISSRCTTLYD